MPHILLWKVPKFDFDFGCWFSCIRHPRYKSSYDLLVICLLHPLAILPTSSVEFPLSSFCELQQNLCSNKSSLLPDTSPSFSPLSSVFRHLSGSLIFGTIWALLALGCCDILTFFCRYAYNNVKTTKSPIFNIFSPLLIIFLCSDTTLMQKSCIFTQFTDLWVMDPHTFIAISTGKLKATLVSIKP